MFEIYQDAKKEFRFRLKASNGQIILSSEGYTSKTACNNGVESVKKNAEEEKRFEKLTAKNGKFHFNLKASNGQVIGSSQMYENESGMLNGIKSVMTNGVKSQIKDLSEEK